MKDFIMILSGAARDKIVGMNIGRERGVAATASFAGRNPTVAATANGVQMLTTRTRGRAKTLKDLFYPHRWLETEILQVEEGRKGISPA